MRDAQKNYVVVGTFLLVLVAALIVWLGVLSGGAASSEAYYMEFENVMGLKKGVQVFYEGYPVGQIEQIALKHAPETPGYRLDVKIKKGWGIPDDSRAVITQAGFLSAVVIDIQAGASNQMLPPGGRIPSVGATNILATVSMVAGKLGELTDTSIKPILDQIMKGTGSLQTLTKDAPVILENLKTFTVQLNKSVEHVNALLDQNGGRVDTILADFEEASGNAASLSAEVRQTGKRLDTLLVSMNTLIEKNKGEIDHSVADLHHTLEVVASHVQEISYNLESTTRNLNEFTAEIRRNPGTLIRGRDFHDDLEARNR
ncbi:MAG: MlaD family protein [Nitrospirota bacterium]|nr:MlaD family protein [Nitrospirota bacterium]